MILRPETSTLLIIDLQERLMPAIPDRPSVIANAWQKPPVFWMSQSSPRSRTRPASALTYRTCEGSPSEHSRNNFSMRRAKAVGPHFFRKIAQT